MTYSDILPLIPANLMDYGFIFINPQFIPARHPKQSYAAQQRAAGHRRGNRRWHSHQLKRKHRKNKT